MRRGRVVGSAEPGSSEADLAELMVGRAVDLRVDKEPAKPTEPRLEVRGLRVANPAGGIVVDGIDFDVRGGEILCVAGVQGNGQSELADTLLGNITPIEGTITMDGVDVTRAKPRATIDARHGVRPRGPRGGRFRLHLHDRGEPGPQPQRPGAVRATGRR